MVSNWAVDEDVKLFGQKGSRQRGSKNHRLKMDSDHKMLVSPPSSAASSQHKNKMCHSEAPSNQRQSSEHSAYQSQQQQSFDIFALKQKSKQEKKKDLCEMVML